MEKRFYCKVCGYVSDSEVWWDTEGEPIPDCPKCGHALEEVDYETDGGNHRMPAMCG